MGGSETEHTTVKLARALRESRGVPEAILIERAVDSRYYHDYLSPLAMPEVQLVADLRDLASRPATPRNSRPLLREMAKRVIAGEFDATKAESDDWARSPEGQETFRQFADDAAFGGIVRRMQEGDGNAAGQPL